MNQQVDFFVNKFWNWLDTRPKLKMLIFLQIAFKSTTLARKTLNILKWILFSPKSSIVDKIKKIYNPKGENWAIITGGSMGIGQSIAILLAKADFNIAIISNDCQSNYETKRILLSLNGSIEVDTLDINLKNFQSNQSSQFLLENEQDIDKQVNYISIIQDQFQHFLMEKSVTLLFNCAGMQVGAGMLEDLETKSVLDMIQVNSIALIQISKLVLEYFNQDVQQKKAIVNMGSFISQMRLVYMSSYGVSKSIVEGFGEGLGIELKDQNIHVLTVTPWHVSTRMTGFRDSDFFIITPDQMAMQILHDLYNEERQTMGHWKHKLLYQLYKVMMKINPKYAFKKLEDDWKKEFKSLVQLNRQISNNVGKKDDKYISDIGIRKLRHKRATPMPDIFNQYIMQNQDRN